MIMRDACDGWMGGRAGIKRAVDVYKLRVALTDKDRRRELQDGTGSTENEIRVNRSIRGVTESALEIWQKGSNQLF